MNHKTKIVATLGPSSEEKSEIETLAKAGMNIARLNFSHGTYDQFKKIVKNIRSVEAKRGKTENPILILQDLQGPKIRIGKVPSEGIKVKQGETLLFDVKAKNYTTHPSKKSPIPLPFAPLAKLLKPGHRLFIEDGLIRTQIVSIKGSIVSVKVLTGGLIKSHKGVNIPDSKRPDSLTLTPKDQKDLEFGVKVLKVDAVALSFVEDAKDIVEIRKRIQKMNTKPIFLIAKIERPKALENLEAILKVADGLMVARGDLGVEIPAEQVPLEQKRIIQACRNAGKPVIVATQILQSMVENPIATRAEISDAATAIFEQTDAYMLSNETATGLYPTKAVQTLTRVAETTEKAMEENKGLFPSMGRLGDMNGSIEDDQMSREAYELAEEVKADALIIATEEGYTARAIVRYRPKTPLIVVSNNADTLRQLHFYWGVRKTVLIKGPLRAEEVRDKLKSKHLKGLKRIVFVRLGKRKRTLVVMSLGK